MESTLSEVVDVAQLVESLTSIQGTLSLSLGTWSASRGVTPVILALGRRIKVILCCIVLGQTR